MTIQRKPKTVVRNRKAAAEIFLTGTPDTQTTRQASPDKGIPKGNKRQISITIAPELLRKVDIRAKAMGTGRSAFISMALYKELLE